MRKLTRGTKQKSDIQITAGADHCDVTMPRTRHGIFIESKKKNKALQMSKGHGALYNLYPTLSANSRMCNNIEIPSCVQASSTDLDLQWQKIHMRASE